MDVTFTDLVKRKIDERREGRSAAVEATAQADTRFRMRVAPVVAAVSEMVTVLSKDPMFAYAMGRPEVTSKREDMNGREGQVSFEGSAGKVTFAIFEHEDIWTRIYPSMAVSQALDCGISYSIDLIKGRLSRLDDLIAHASEHIADFLADIYWSPAAHILRPVT